MRNELNGQGAGGEHGMDTHTALMAQMGASKFCAILPGATQSSVQLTEAFITGAPCLQSQQKVLGQSHAHLATDLDCQRWQYFFWQLPCKAACDPALPKRRTSVVMVGSADVSGIPGLTCSLWAGTAVLVQLAAGCGWHGGWQNYGMR